MQKAVPYLRLLFLVLFIALLVSGKLMLWLVLYGTSLLFPLVFGKRIYCMLMCPINTAVSVVVKAKAKLGKENRPAPQWLTRKWLPWVTLINTVALFFFFRVKMGKPLPVMLLWILVAITMTLFYHQDVFHDGVCPYGALQRLLAKISLKSDANRRISQNYGGFSKSVLNPPNNLPSI